jgi:hypothetical protein
MIKKTASYGFAAKGGDNEELHNHNDVGSFIFARNGRQLISDIGGGVYSRQYFSNDTRYGYLECRSGGHSVPLINGAEQRFGKSYAARNATYENGVFSIDISGAYGIAELTTLKRSFAFEEDKVTLTDEIGLCGDGTVTERFITLIEPIPKGDGVIGIGDCVLRYGDTVDQVKISTENSSKGYLVYKIDFELKSNERYFTCSVS